MRQIPGCAFPLFATGFCYATLTRPETSAALFATLAEAGTLATEQAAAARRWVGFRNVLVRQYAEIDRSIVYQALRHELDELKALAAAVAEMILDDDFSASG